MRKHTLIECWIEDQLTRRDGQLTRGAEFIPDFTLLGEIVHKRLSLIRCAAFETTIVFEIFFWNFSKLWLNNMVILLCFLPTGKKQNRKLQSQSDEFAENFVVGRVNHDTQTEDR